MPTETREVRPYSQHRQILAADGRVLVVPDGWSLLPPGDAALSRRIKADGPTWTVIEVKGRKRFSHGIWAPEERIATLQDSLRLERLDPSYQRKLDAGRKRRAAEQEIYAEEFLAAVRRFLGFHSCHRAAADLMSRLITAHAVPVGSGTVARTERIPIEQRAEAATIAWMRHQTTGYDTMVIPLVKGRRREIRRMLAQRSVQLLARYRSGGSPDSANCPLVSALARHSAPSAALSAAQSLLEL